MSGCQKRWKKAAWITLGIGLMLAPATLSAQEPAQPATEQPEADLIEFLGIFDDEESSWIDPMVLLEADEKDFVQPGSEEDKHEKP